MPFLGLVVNRVHGGAAKQRRTRAARTRGERVLEPLLSRLLALQRDELVLARAEERAITRLLADTGLGAVRVPELPTDVHDLRGLAQVALMLAPEAA
jgi:hypothetical protein